MLERIARFLTEWTGSPVSEGVAGGALVVVIGAVVLGLVVLAWFKSGIEENKAVDAEWERFENDLYK